MAASHSTDLGQCLSALRTHDPEMHPRFRLGEIAIFNCGEVAEPGDDVVVKFNDGSVKVRSLAAIDESTVTLRTYSPNKLSVLQREHIKGMFPVEARRSARDWGWITSLKG